MINIPKTLLELDNQKTPLKGVTMFATKYGNIITIMPLNIIRKRHKQLKLKH